MSFDTVGLRAIICKPNPLADQTNVNPALNHFLVLICWSTIRLSVHLIQTIRVFVID